MKVVALISGGKDSLFNCLHCVANGHELVALANLHPPTSADSAELDSFCFQTVGHDLVEAVAECMELPLLRRPLLGTSKNQSSVYHHQRRHHHLTSDEDDDDSDRDGHAHDDENDDNDDDHDRDEVEDLFELLCSVRARFPEVEAVSVGAILSNYQRVRVEHVCARLGWTCLAYLWRQPQSRLLETMLVRCRVVAVVVKVAAMGLTPADVGRSLLELYPNKLLRMHRLYDVHVAGEGGEYETITVDCPLFRKRLVFDDDQQQVIVHSEDGISQVAYLQVNKYHLEQKTDEDYFVLMDDEQDVAARDGRVKLDLRKVQDLQKILGIASATSTTTTTASVVNGKRLDRSEEADEAVKERSKAEEAMVVAKRVPMPSMSLRRIGDSFLTVSNVWSLSSSSSPSSLSCESSVVEQARSVLGRIGEALRSQGLGFRHVVMSHVYLSSMEDFGRFNAVYRAFFGVNHPAARACVALPLSRYLSSASSSASSSLSASSSAIGMQILACFDPTERMHVQSISYWAPANIGPYSQAVRMLSPEDRAERATSSPTNEDDNENDHRHRRRGRGRPFDPIFLAGQIGMVPRSLDLAQDVDHEIRLSLQHVRSIAGALLWNRCAEHQAESGEGEVNNEGEEANDSDATIVRLPDDVKLHREEVEVEVEVEEHAHQNQNQQPQPQPQPRPQPQRRQRLSWQCAPVPETECGSAARPHPSPIITTLCYLSPGKQLDSNSHVTMERAHAHLERSMRGYQMPTIYVTVDALPKRANVEWEVVLWDPRNYTRPRGVELEERCSLVSGIFIHDRWSTLLQVGGNDHDDDHDSNNNSNNCNSTVRVLEHQQAYCPVVDGQRLPSHPLSQILAVERSTSGGDGGRVEAQVLAKAMSFLEARLREPLRPGMDGTEAAPLSIRCFHAAELGLNDEWIQWRDSTTTMHGIPGITWLPVHSIHLPRRAGQSKEVAGDIFMAILMQY